jgi:hypothetical protein
VQGADTGLAKREAQTRGIKSARDAKRASLTACWNRDDVDTPSLMPPMIPAAAKNKPKTHETSRRADETSGSHTGCARRNDSVPQKVIGRTTPLVFRGCGRGSGLFGEDGALALIHQPARQHGRGIFLEVLIQERSQFLAQIRRMSEAGKFIALQGIAGSGEQEFPGRLGVIGVHENLPDQVLWKRPENSTTRTYIVTSNHAVTSLWKSVQIVEIALRACSGCAGDYEDPDRSAWEPDPEENEEDTAVAEIPEEKEPAAPGGGERPEAE